MLRNANLGTKKKKLPKNLDRMSAARLAVESIDSEVQECQTKFKAAKTKPKKVIH